ncbi:MAG: hypothetical protein DHS20C16_01010 [Phycisphaerae bacterium]|nr:MAG: hypothetical protein DHS20C16_01010 [Phycisphaerae bacterium]
MMWRKLRAWTLMFVAGSVVLLMASCQAPQDEGGSSADSCVDETDCAEGEVCVFDSAENGLVCRDGALFGL